MNRIKLLLLIFFTGEVISGSSQNTIQRWPDKKNEVENKELAATCKNNVFRDYGWTRPDLKSQQLNLNSGQGEWNFNKQLYKIKIDGEQLSLTAPDGKVIEVKKQKSHG